MQENTRYENLKNFALEFIDFLAAHKTDGMLFSEHRKHVGAEQKLYGQHVDDHYDHHVDPDDMGGFPTLNLTGMVKRDGFEQIKAIDDTSYRGDGDERVIVSIAVDRDKVLDLLQKYNLNG